MADNNNFENIKEGFSYIADVLDSMRAQNAMNSGNSEKVLANINKSLEELANEENSDLIKVYLAELKRSLEERHNFVSSKFSEIEDSFKTIVQKTENQLQGSEIKEVFDIIATNLNVFSRDFSSQKDLISEISLKIEELKQDDSQKKDILRNIAVLKVELEKFSNGFESIILNLNDNFKETAQVLAKLDSSEALSGLKKDIDNVFLSSNAILSTLQVIDHKNRELEEVIKHVVTKDDFELERDQVAKLITQNIQISEFISALPKQTHVESLTEKVDTAVGVINALKNMLNDTGKQNQKMLTAQLDNLESKILNISTEEEFIGFRKELAEFTQEITQSTNLMRADIADTNTELKDLLAFLSSMNIKESFETFAGHTKASETSLKQSISESTTQLTKEIEKNKNLTKIDIAESTANVSEKLEQTKKELTDSAKANQSGILEHLQSVIHNIFSVKNALHIENAETAEAIDGKLEELKENLVASNNYIVQNSKENLENIVANVEKVFQELCAVKENIGETSATQGQNLSSGFSHISKKISEIKEELNQNSQENFASILSIVEDFSKEFATIKSSLEQSAQESSDEVKGFISELSDKLGALKNILKEEAKENAIEVKSAVDSSIQAIYSLKAGLDQTSTAGFSGIRSSVGELSQKLESVQEALSMKSETNLSKLVVLFEDLSNEFNAHKAFMSESAQINFESVSLYIQNLNKRIEEAKNEFGEDLKANLSDLQESIAELPSTIRENQAAFENENKSLMEENARNITELGEKIQNLVRGIISKDNPFKENILGEFVELKASLALIKEDLSAANSELGEQIKFSLFDSIETVEKTISGYNEQYKQSLFGLQNNLKEYFENAQNSAQESDLKLDNSLKEASEIKEEVHSIIDLLDELKEDSTLAEFSASTNKKFEGILLNITNLEEIFSSKNSASLQNVLSALEEKFETVSQELKEYKEFSSTEINEFLSEIEEKVELLKTQVGLTGTDVLSSLSGRYNEIIASIAPIGNSIEKLCSVNLEEMILGIKSKMDNSYFTLSASINENIKGEGSAQIEKIAQEFETINEKLEDLASEILSNKSDEFEELKSALDSITYNVSDVLNTVNDKIETEFFTQNFSSVKTAISSAKKQNEDALNCALNSLLNKLEEINGASTSFESTILDTKEAIFERLDGIKERLIDAQEEAKSSILSEISQSQEATKATLLNEIQESAISVKEDYNLSTKSVVSQTIETALDESRDMVFDKLESIHEKLTIAQEVNKNTLLDELSQAQDEAKVALLSELRKGQSESQAAIIDNIETNIAELKEESSSTQSALSEIIENSFENSREVVFEKLYAVEEKLIEIQNDSKTSILNRLETSIAGLKEKSSSTISELAEKIETSLETTGAQTIEKIDSIENKLFDAQDEVKSLIIDELNSSLAELKEKSEASHEAITETIDTNFESSRELVFEKLDAIQNKLIDAQDDAKDSILEDFTCAQEETKTAIIEEINKAQNQTETIILEELGENINFIKEIMNSLSVGEDLREELVSKLEGLEYSIKTASQGLENKISNAQETHKTSTQLLLSEVKTSFYEKVDDSLDELRSFIELLEDKNDFSTIIDSLKSELCDKFTEISESLGVSIEAISVKDELDELGKKLELSLDDLFANVEEKFITTINESETISNLGEKSEEINRRIEELKRVVSEEITEKLDGFELNIDNKNQDFASKLEDMMTSLEELRESYIDLSLNSNMELSSSLLSVQEKIEEMGERLNSLVFRNDVVEIVENSKNEINESLAMGLESINQKLDVLAEPDTAMEESVKEIKQIIESQSEFIEKIERLEELSKLDELGKLDNLAMLEELSSLEKLSELEGLSGIKADIQSALNEFNEKLKTFNTDKPSDDSTAQEIKESLEGLKTDLFENLIEVFNQISFVEESEDIKDFIEEKTDELKEEIMGAISSKLSAATSSAAPASEGEDYGSIGDIRAFVDITKKELRESLKSSLGTNFNDILSSLDILHEKTGSVDYNCFNLVNEIKEMKSKLLSGTTSQKGETPFDDSYTLLDVESDIAKIRLALKELSLSKEERPNVDLEGLECLNKLNDLNKLDDLYKLDSLDKMNDDLTSISTRTNKLLLNSDESYNVLKDNLNDFRSIVYKIEERIKHIDNTDKINKIGRQVEDVNKLMLSSANSDKIFTQTFMYLAEWIDKADERLSNIEEKLSDVENIKQSVNTIQKNMLKSSDLESLFDKFAKKFDQQNVKMKAMEEKITQLSKKAPAKATKDTDLKLLVKEVLSQFDKPEKVNATLAKKVDSIDKQLMSFGKSIEKITSYVD